MSDETLPLICVCVPVHNAARTLPACVDSILAQTYPNIRIVLVNNGSRDDSLKVCERYRDQHPDIIVIDQEKGDVSLARNAGVAATDAPLVGFVDSDDTIDEGMYMALYRALTAENTQVAGCGYFDCYADGREIDRYPEHESFTAAGPDAVKRFLLEQGLLFSVCVKLFRRQVLVSHPFQPDLHYEDADALLRMFEDGASIAVDNTPYYRYRHSNDSRTTATYSRKNLDRIWVFRRAYRRIEATYPQLAEEARYRYITALFYVYDKMIVDDAKIDRWICDVIRRTINSSFNDVVRGPYFTLKRKVMAGLLRVSPTVYESMTSAKTLRESREHQTLDSSEGERTH